MKTFLKPAVLAAALAISLAACATGNDDGRSREPSRPVAEAPQTAPINAAQAQRLQRIMAPLIRHMDHPIPAGQVKLTLWADPHINAANAGGGDFYVTTGLLQRASDDQLRAILAHETAHADLGHVAKTQTLATGVSIGILLLEQIVPGSSALTPIAGQLVLNGYSRGEETEADAHGVTILRRAGYDGKAMMASTLAWLARSEGDGGGGFFATHPATGERIADVQKLP